MALFSRSKKTPSATTEVVATGKEEKKATVSVVGTGHAHFLKSPRITEKSTMHAEAGVYVFDIDAGATKRDVLLAVRRLYSVTPRMVRIVNVPRKVKRSMRTGRTGISGGGKKAYVYLKKGEQISLS